MLYTVLLILSYCLDITIIGIGVLLVVTVGSIAKNYHSLSFEKVLIDRFMLFGIVALAFFCYNIYSYRAKTNDDYVSVYNCSLKSIIIGKECYQTAIVLDLSNSKPITFRAAGYSWFHNNDVLGDSIFKKAYSDSIKICHNGEIIAFKITKLNLD